MQIWATTSFSGANALASIAFSKAGGEKAFPTRRFCGADFSALTRFTHFYNGGDC
jgi:hypothetical protein